jgi:hypothetical protein
MQPDLAGSLAAKRKQPVVPLISSATVEAAARRRADQVTVEPLGQAAGEGSQFSLMAGEPCLELSDPRPFIEEGPPVFGRPVASTKAQEGKHSRFVLGKRAYERLRRGADADSTRLSPSTST